MTVYRSMTNTVYKTVIQNKHSDMIAILTLLDEYGSSGDDWEEKEEQQGHYLSVSSCRDST